VQSTLQHGHPAESGRTCSVCRTGFRVPLVARTVADPSLRCALHPSSRPKDTMTTRMRARSFRPGARSAAGNFGDGRPRPPPTTGDRRPGRRASRGCRPPGPRRGTAPSGRPRLPGPVDRPRSCIRGHARTGRRGPRQLHRSQSPDRRALEGHRGATASHPVRRTPRRAVQQRRTGEGGGLRVRARTMARRRTVGHLARNHRRGLGGPPDWISAQVRARAGGAHVWLGGVRVEDWTDRGPGTAEAWRQRDDEERRPVHGANFGIDARTYLEAGGFPGLPPPRTVRSRTVPSPVAPSSTVIRWSGSPPADAGRHGRHTASPTPFPRSRRRSPPEPGRPSRASAADQTASTDDERKDPVDQEALAELLNEDLSLEYQSIVQYNLHISTVTGPSS